MSAFSTTTNPPRLSRWLVFLVVLFTTEVGLLFWHFLPVDLPQLWMAKILPVSEKLSWYLTRSSGTVAYLALSLSTVWGLLLSTKVIKEWVPARLTLAMHNSLAWIAVGLSFFHAFVLLFDSYYTYTVANLLIPFTGPYAPLWIGIGTVNFYLLLLISASFYMRSRIGTKNWRRLHYLTFAAFLFVTLHGWMAGTDSTQLKPMYLVSAMLVLFLTIYRILDAIQHSHRQLPRPHSPRPVQP